MYCYWNWLVEWIKNLMDNSSLKLKKQKSVIYICSFLKSKIFSFIWTIHYVRQLFVIFLIDTFFHEKNSFRSQKFRSFAHLNSVETGMGGGGMMNWSTFGRARTWRSVMKSLHTVMNCWVKLYSEILLRRSLMSCSEKETRVMLCRLIITNIIQTCFFLLSFHHTNHINSF